jgi:hypothetical protein
MSISTPVISKNLDIYGYSQLPWSRAYDQIEAKAIDNHDAFIGTVRPDGRPHIARVGAIWFDGALVFVSHDQSQKAKNIACNPNCTFAVSIEGIDLTLEGISTRVTDPLEVKRICEAYVVHGWPAEAVGDGVTAPYMAPSAGPAPWNAYRFDIRSAVGVATAEPYGATRWEFTE